MNNSCFHVGQVCNLSGQDAILSYDYFCDAIIRHAGVNSAAELAKSFVQHGEPRKSWRLPLQRLGETEITKPPNQWEETSHDGS
jgi:hypothetical protein